MYSRRRAIGGEIKTDSTIIPKALNLGLLYQLRALPLMMQTPLPTLCNFAMSAQQLGQLKCCTSTADDECVGYVIWALLTPDVERGVHCREALGHWLTGNTAMAPMPWVLDMAVAPGSLRYVLEDLRGCGVRGARNSDLRFRYQGRAPPVQARQPSGWDEQLHCHQAAGGLQHECAVPAQ